MSERIRKSQSSAAGNYQAGFMGLRPIPRQRGLFVKSPLWIPEKQRLAFIVWVLPTALKVSKGRRTRRRLLMDYTF